MWSAATYEEQTDRDFHDAEPVIPEPRIAVDPDGRRPPVSKTGLEIIVEGRKRYYGGKGKASTRGDRVYVYMPLFGVNRADDLDGTFPHGWRRVTIEGASAFEGAWISRVSGEIVHVQATQVWLTVPGTAGAVTDELNRIRGGYYVADEDEVEGTDEGEDGDDDGDPACEECGAPEVDAGIAAGWGMICRECYDWKILELKQQHGHDGPCCPCGWVRSPGKDHCDDCDEAIAAWKNAEREKSGEAPAYDADDPLAVHWMTWLLCVETTVGKGKITDHGAAYDAFLSGMSPTAYAATI